MAIVPYPEYVLSRRQKKLKARKESTGSKQISCVADAFQKN